MKSIVYLILVLGLLVSFYSCKKEPIRQPEAVASVLSVKLHQDYLSAAQVDSAFATWKINGREQRVQLQLSGDSLKADISSWQDGNGTVTLHIYANKKYRNQYLGQWVLARTVVLQKNTSLHYEGPSSFYDAAWFPRVQLKDQIGHEAVLALRPDDAYFFIRNPGHPFIRLTVERVYWKTVGGVFYAGGYVWSCTQNCTDVANEESFKPLPQRIGNNPWNHISITVLFEIDVNGGGSVLSLECEP
jgi:hypothetical protein